MDILQIVGLGCVATVLILLVKQQRPEIATQLSLAAGIIIFLLVISKIGTVLTMFNDLASKAHINQMYLNTLFKVIGIAYVAEFGSQVCRDAGEGAIASKIELAGKVFIMIMSMPIIIVVLDIVSNLLL